MSKDKNEQTLGHQSGVNPQGEPFIQLLLNRSGKDEVISQLTLDDAREHALAVLEAAEASRQDAFLMWFVREKMGGDLQMASALIQEFRHWREVQTGIQSGMKVIPKGHAKGEA